MNYYNIIKLLHSLMILMELFETTGLSQSFHFVTIGLEQKIEFCQIVKQFYTYVVQIVDNIIKSNKTKLFKIN